MPALAVADALRAEGAQVSFIGGGRKIVRTTLYTGALVAAQHNQTLKASATSSSPAVSRKNSPSLPSLESS